MLTAKQVRGLFFDYWWIAALAILLLSVTFWLFCGDGRNNKNEQLESNIDQQKGVNAQLQNQINAQQNEVNNAANQSNQAGANFNNSVNRDSNSFSGNATDKFCERFPCDSSCQEWRIRNRKVCG